MNETVRPQLASISEDDAQELVRTREGSAYVLDLLSRTARPGSGAAPLLRTLGQLAKSIVDAFYADDFHWFEGSLIIEIVSVGMGITVDVMSDSASSRESAFSRFYFEIPFDELRWMLDRVPELSGPLHARPFANGLTLYMQKPSAGFERSSADDTMKIVVTPESLIDPDSTSPVPALMAELAVLLRASQIDPREME